MWKFDMKPVFMSGSLPETELNISDSAYHDHLLNSYQRGAFDKTIAKRKHLSKSKIQKIMFKGDGIGY